MPSELFAVSHPQAGSSCDSPRFGVGYCSFKRPPPPPPSSPSVCCARNHFPTLSPTLVSPWPTYLDRRPQKPSRSGAIPPFGRAGVRVWRRIWRAGKLTLLLLAMNTTGRSAADPTLFPNAHIWHCWVSATMYGCIDVWLSERREATPTRQRALPRDPWFPALQWEGHRVHDYGRNEYDDFSGFVLKAQEG
ncbi:hypothetical protein BKA80DRAFT_255397 [Phyllosticta citrichinensis]